MSEILIGVDLGGTFIKTALVSADGKVIAKSSRPSNAETGPALLMDNMADAVNDLMAEGGVKPENIIAAGFGAPGPMNWQSGVVFSPPNLPGWKDVPLADEMKARLGVSCYVDNDANAACYGEYWLGAGRGTESMVVLTLGTGVGGGVVVFGKLLRGIDGTAAELGHLKVQRDGRNCGCGARGCLEAYASVRGMVLTTMEGLKTGRKTVLGDQCGHDTMRLNGKMIFDAAKDGDELGLWVFEETATWLGLGISSIINYQNPERVVLCGGMIDAGEMLFKTVRDVVNANTFEVPAKRCQIVAAGLGTDAGVLGAAGCALDRVKNG